MYRTSVYAASALLLVFTSSAAAVAQTPGLVSWRPSSGMWSWTTTAAGDGQIGTRQWGNQSLGDTPFSADVDGDGIMDLVVWRPTNGTWYWATSSSAFATTGSRQFGNAAYGDVPLVGDIDGDRRADLIVWRASTGTWYWVTSSSNYTDGGSRQWGNQGLGDQPLVGDIDGDHRADLVVWRASTGTWYWTTTSTRFTNGSSRQWGCRACGDVPRLGDVDGDGRADLVVWRGSTGTWYWTTSSTGYTNGSSRQWGNQALGDIPLLADLDGDGRSDLSVWRPASATWWWLGSAGGFSTGASKAWGANGDVPLIGVVTAAAPAPAPAPAPRPISGSSTELRVLQWNTHHGGVGTDGVYNPDRIATWAAQMNPDVIFFNEIERNDYWGYEDQPERYKQMLEQKTGRTWYYVFAQEFGQWDASGKGNMILSRFPIVSSDRYLMAQNADRSIGLAAISVNGRSITLLSTHLDPDSQPLRLAQAVEVTTWSSVQPENRILAGDMNAWPDQSSIAQLNQYFYDSWATAEAQSTAIAFPGNTGQTKNGRIDYIFYSKGASALSVLSSQVIDTRDAYGVMPSDHRPVLTTFSVR